MKKTYRYSLQAILIISISTLCCGCATRAAYEQQLNGYVGKSIDTIIDKGNIPSREYASPSGNKIYCFNSSSYMTVPMTATPTQSVSTVVGKNIYTTNYGGTIMGGQTVTIWCNTCFVTNSKRIIMKYNLQGNNCVANQP